MPSRQELCIKNLFNVADCKMHWQKNGDYLCVKVDRYSKAKKIDEKDQFKYSVSKDQFNAVYEIDQFKYSLSEDQFIDKYSVSKDQFICCEHSEKSQNVELQSVFFLHVTFWFFFLQGLYYNFELFRIREKQIPVDKVEVKGKLIYYPRRFILLFFLLKLFLCESSWLSFCRKCDCICLGACWQSICIYTWRIPQDFSFILPDQTRESGNYQ